MRARVDKSGIAVELERARTRRDALLAPLSAGGLVQQVSQIMSPLVWDFAHIGQWTSSHFTAYSGFHAFPYPEYSEVFFGEDYRVLRGGSWATDPLVARTTFRNWDHPERRQIFAGIRCAHDA